MTGMVINEYGENVFVMDASERGSLTKEEEEMIARLDDFVDEDDEDCPPMPERMAEQMQREIEERKKKRAAMRATAVTA